MESVLFKFSVGNFSKHLTIFVCQHEWISSVNRSRNPLQNEAWYYYGIPTQCDCFIHYLWPSDYVKMGISTDV
mgnify:CR=1 FL=1